MRQKARKAIKHDVEIFGRSVSVLLLAGLLVAGGASAALLDNFGTITGEADIEQAVYIEGSGYDAVEASYDGTIVAGQTFQDEFSLANDAEVDAEVEFNSTNEYEGISQAVYEVQEIGLYEGTEESGTPIEEDSLSDNAEHDVTVRPNMDQIEYTFPRGNEHVEIVVSPAADSEEDNLEVTYRDDGTGWLVAERTNEEHHYGEDTEQLVDEWDEVEKLEADDEQVTIAFAREGEDQSVGVSIRGDDARYFTEEFGFDEQSTGNLVDLSHNDLMESSHTVEAGESSDLVTGTQFALNVASRNYYVGVDVIPDTDSENIE